MKSWFASTFSAFKDNVDAVLKPANRRFEDVIKYISIGGEVDAFLTTGAPSDYSKQDSWSNWFDFYSYATEHIRQLVPRVKLGSVMILATAWELFTNAKAASPDQTVPRILNEHSDFAGFTSYPSQDAVFVLDDPAATVTHAAGTKDQKTNYSVTERIKHALEIAGDLPVVMEEFGYPTYDGATIQALQKAWPDRGVDFPASFFSSGFSYPFGDQIPKGVPAQAKAINLAFEAWDAAKLRLPVFIWFTAFEMHVEGRPCHCFPNTPVDLRGYCLPDDCDPCIEPACHMCGPGEGVDFLGTGTDERAERFFGTCGLIRSDGVSKASWPALMAKIAALKAAKGN